MRQHQQFIPARDIGDFPFGQETLLFKESTQDFCRLNETASIIWKLVKRGHDEPVIIAQLVRDYAVAPAIAEEFARSILRDLVSSRFLNDDLLSSAAETTAGAERSLPPDSRAALPVLAHRACFNVRNVFFEVFSDSRRCIDLLDGTFGFLKSRRKPAKHESLVRICIESETGKRFTVRYGKTVLEGCTLDELAPVVHSVFVLLFYEVNFASLAFHCAAVCSDVGVILMPGASGSGKSTLTAALVASGFPYITDELVLVDVQQNSILGAPLAIGLKKGSWDLIGEFYPDIGQLAPFLRQDGQRIRYVAPASVCEEYALDGVNRIVFPRLVDEDILSLHPLAVPETFARLTEAGYDTSRKLRKQDVGTILDWIGSIPAYELRYSNLGGAVREIVALSKI